MLIFSTEFNIVIMYFTIFFGKTIRKCWIFIASVKIIRDNKWLETFNLLGETNLWFSNNILFSVVFFTVDDRKQQNDFWCNAKYSHWLSVITENSALALFPLHVTLPNTPISVKNWVITQWQSQNISVYRDIIRSISNAKRLYDYAVIYEPARILHEMERS